MANQTISDRNSTIRAYNAPDTTLRLDRDQMYLKTTDNSEYVAGLAFETDTTTTSLVKIYAGGTFGGVFDKQNVGARDANGLLNNNYAFTGLKANTVIPYLNPTPVNVIINATQTIAFGDEIQCSATGGYFEKWDGARPAIGYALEAITTTTERKVGSIMLYPMKMDNPFNGLKMISETIVTATAATTGVPTYSCTLTHVPLMVMHAEAATQTATDYRGKNITVNTTDVYPGEVHVNYTTGFIHTSATDKITHLTVRYWY
jgi:hypothetical protein